MLHELTPDANKTRHIARPVKNRGQETKPKRPSPETSLCPSSPMVHRPVPGAARQLFGLAKQLLTCLGHSCQSILQPSCTSSAFPFSVPLLSTYIHVLSVRVRVGSRVCCRDFLPNNTCCASRSGSLGSHAQSSLSFLLAQQRDVRCFLYLFFFGSQTEERSLPMNSELTGQAAGSSHAEPCERGGGEEGSRLLQPCLGQAGGPVLGTMDLLGVRG